MNSEEIISPKDINTSDAAELSKKEKIEKTEENLVNRNDNANDIIYQTFNEKGKSEENRLTNQDIKIVKKNDELSGIKDEKMEKLLNDNLLLKENKKVDNGNNLIDNNNKDKIINEFSKELNIQDKNKESDDEINKNQIQTNDIENMIKNDNNNINKLSSNFNGTHKVSNYELTQNIGFNNIGHTCYMNSFLQILLHTPNFLPKIKELYYNKVNENTLIYNLIKLSEYPYDSRYLKEIKKTIAKTFPKYGEYAQNDTQNFAIDFIDTMINEIKEETSFMSESNDKDDNTEIITINDNISYKIKKYKAFLSDFEKSGEKTFIEDLFLFYESKIRYNGELIEKNKIRFDLSLNVELTFNIKDLKDNYTLYELLDIKYNNFNRIFKEKDIIEEIKNEKNLNEIPKENPNFFCKYFKNFLETINIFGIFNSCIIDNDFHQEEINKEKINIYIDQPKNSIKNLEKPKEIAKITYLPRILIISFVRGIEGQDLISSSISFNEEIDVKNYVEKDLFDNNLGTKYKLYAINVRDGYTKSSGHCYSYVKVKNEWICYNDTSAHKENPSFNLNNVAGLYYINKDI